MNTHPHDHTAIVKVAAYIYSGWNQEEKRALALQRSYQALNIHNHGAVGRCVAASAAAVLVVASAVFVVVVDLFLQSS